MNITLGKGIKQVWIVFITFLLIFSICLFNVQSNRARQLDTDDDGIIDSEEIKYHTDYHDSDSDDDGVLDGDEIDWNKNTDGTGDINALDPDSDDDGVYDGTEMGITKAHNDTDLNRDNFHADADPKSNTSMVHWDSDHDCKSDGEEDLNKNGKYDKELNETDPLFPDTDEDGIPNNDDLDRDGDGMYDEFERLYNLDTCDPNDGELDKDGDGYTNLREYLGDDNNPGNNDWSDPTNPLDWMDLSPVVKFSRDEITNEANQTIIFNNKILSVLDRKEDYQAGLKYTWDFGDGNIESEIVYDPAKYSKNYTYKIPGEYPVQLKVEDQSHNIGNDSIEIAILKITLPPGYGPISVPKSSYNYDYWGLLLMLITIFSIVLIIILVVYYYMKKDQDY